MRIFDEQRKSRLESTKIIFLFILSVVGTVFIIDFLILHILQQAGLGLNSKTIVVWCSIATVTIIAGGYAYHRYLLSSGGTAVALMLGGVEVDNRSKDIYERRFLNVVSEVSIAANIPTPSAFILESEDSINAFAAGFDSNDYVVAITRGALKKLTRDELSGVIAHEVGHLSNGDARLNIHLLSMLGGLMCIALFGGWLAEQAAHTGSSRSRNNPAGIIILIGITLWAAGYVGVFFGKVIKAMLSREREFYADARALQYTRNPDGIGGALRKIAGSSANIKHYNSNLLSYMFLEGTESSWMDTWFSTHPPIKERIERLYGRPMPELKSVEYTESQLCNETHHPLVAGFSGLPLVNPALSSNVQVNGLKMDNILNNQDMLFGMLIAIIDVDNVAGISHLKFGDASKIINNAKFLKPEVDKLSLHERLQTLNLLSPSIRRLPVTVKDAFQQSVDNIISADNKCTIEELLFGAVLHRRLERVIVHKRKYDFKEVAAALLKIACSYTKNPEQNFLTACKKLDIEHISYEPLHDLSEVLLFLSAPGVFPLICKNVLYDAIKALDYKDLHPDERIGGLLNVLAMVMELPDAILDKENCDFDKINKVLNS